MTNLSTTLSMSRWRALLVALVTFAMVAGMLAATPASARADDDDDDDDDGGGDEVATYVVTFTNLTAGQPMTPPVVALHDDDVAIWQRGKRASAGVEAIAEGGDNAPLLDALGQLDDVGDFGQAGSGPFGPGESVSIALTAHDDDQVLSSINMLVCTNDGFTGLNSIELPEDGSARYRARAYDAGTEINTNQQGDVPPVPPCASLDPGGGGDQDAIAENRRIRRHRGLQGYGAIDFARRQRVIEITVERADVYNVAITNLTDGQPMTPPVVAIHDPSISLFEPGQPASAGIEAIAEVGDNGPLVAVAGMLDEVSAAGVAGAAPFGAGETVDVTLVTTESGHVLSTVNMVICSNDGITGLHNVDLPSSGSETYTAIAYDAGTEINTFLQGDVPPAPPCAQLPAGGGGDQDLLTEGGVVAPHPGLAGAGSIDFAPGVAVVSITVTNLG